MFSLTEAVYNSTSFYGSTLRPLYGLTTNIWFHKSQITAQETNVHYVIYKSENHIVRTAPLTVISTFPCYYVSYIVPHKIFLLNCSFVIFHKVDNQLSSSKGKKLRSYLLALHIGETSKWKHVDIVDLCTSFSQYCILYVSS